MDLLGLVLNVQNAVIQGRGQRQMAAVRLGVIADITGDRLKTAVLLPDGVVLNGGVCLRSPPAGTLPCPAAATPQVSRGALNWWNEWPDQM